VCVDDDPCTLEVCLDGTCNHQPIACDDFDICTKDTCVNGVCSHEPIPRCEGSSLKGSPIPNFIPVYLLTYFSLASDCKAIGSCSECENSGCAWLQCYRDTSALSNVTSFVINNSSGLHSFYTHTEAPVLQEAVDG